MKKTSSLIIIALGIALMVVANLKWGSVSLSWGEIGEGLSTIFSQSEGNIISNVRLPEIIVASLAGIALALSGLLMQTFFRNPLAGPSVLGISSGASLGVALVLLINFNLNLGFAQGGLVVGAALLGTAIMIALLLLFASVVKDNTSLLIVGLMAGYFVSAIVSSLTVFAGRVSLQKFVFWGLGSFSLNMDYELLFIAVVVVVTSIALYFMSKPLDTYLLGEDHAFTLGLNVKKWRWIIIGITGILTGIITAYTGPIAFVGLAVPHLARLIFKTSNHRWLIPACVLMGVLVTLACLLISKLPGLPYRLPINAVTSLVGAPVVIYLVYQQKSVRL